LRVVAVEIEVLATAVGVAVLVAIVLAQVLAEAALLPSQL
jgi:hypothetical protein